MRGGAECAVATMRAVVLASPGPTLTGPGPTFIAARTPVVGGRQRPPSVPGSTQVYGGDHGEGVRSEGADGRSLSGVPPTSDPTAAVLSLVDAFDYTILLCVWLRPTEYSNPKLNNFHPELPHANCPKIIFQKKNEESERNRK